MEYAKLKNMLIKHEGIRLKPYRCPAGKLTIGVGHNLDDVGISKKEAMVLLDNDIESVVSYLRNIFDSFDSLPSNVQLVLSDMRFQLGSGGFRSFRRMITAVEDNNWPGMISQMKDSRWFKQTPNRANELINMIVEVV